MRKYITGTFFIIYIQLLTAQVGQIRWGTNLDLLDGVTVTWSNSSTDDSIAWGYSTSLEKGHFPAPKRGGYSTPNFFHYQFPKLESETRIFYSIWNSNNKTWGNQHTFNTAPNPDNNKFSFAALGDCRSSPSVLTKVSNYVEARKPAVCLFNGDLTQSGNSAGEYNTFFSASSNFLENCLVLHAEGNHDASSPVTFSNLWDLPVTNGSNLYYSVRYGNTLFVTINSCDPGNSTMVKWLHDVLSKAASDASITWKIISFHHPFFNVGAHQGDMNNYRSTIWKEFDDHGVDIIFNGHDHNYQRSKPINLSVSSSSPVANFGSRSGEGRLQIISGGAGASLYAKGSTNDAWAISTFNSTYNYVYCDIDGCVAKITAYNSNNTVIDNVTLDKSGTSINCGSSGQQPIEKTQVYPLFIYPNPAKNNFLLNYSSPINGEITITIIDEKGKLIHQEKLTKNAESFEYNGDVSQLSKGIYNVSLETNGHRDGGILIVR